jgi:hypothetical protein
MRTLLGLFVVILSVTVAIAQMVFVPLSGQGLKTATNTKVGIYWWGGSLTGVPLANMYTQGQTLADSLLTTNASGVIRVMMSSKSAMDYVGGACTLNSSLTNLAQSSIWNTILSDTTFATILITGYDWVSLPDCFTKNYLDPTFFTSANSAAVTAEWKAFAQYLGATFPSKTFILEAWEGDNDCWCGASSVATLANCPNGPTHVSGYTLWMQARSAGIAAARMPNVKSGIEFNDLDFLQPQGLPSILYTVVPQVTTDYVSYSFYDSKFRVGTFAADILKIRKQMINSGHNPSTLLIGELGYATNNSNKTDESRVVGFLNVARNARIPYVTIWNMFDLDSSGNNTGFGAYDANGNLKPYGMSISLY